MEYKYKTYTELYIENACSCVEDEVETIEDLMITYWVPSNFSDKTFNFLLRRNHLALIPMQSKFFKTVERSWITNLGFSEQYFFQEIAKETKDGETIITNNLVKLDLGKKQVIDKNILIKKHNNPNTEVRDI